MARKSANPPEPVEPEEESQELPEDESEGDDEPGPVKGNVSKTHAARVALAEGYEKPTEAVKFIRKRFGIKMANQQFSTIKAKEKQKAGVPAAGEEPQVEKRKPSSASPDPAPQSAPAANAGADIMDDLTSVKALVRKLGAEQVRKIVDLFE